MESRIVSFRLNEMVYETLSGIAYSENKDPSACIREAIGQYIRDKSKTGLNTGLNTGRDTGLSTGLNTGRASQEVGADLGAWIGRSRKL